MERTHVLSYSSPVVSVCVGAGSERAEVSVDGERDRSGQCYTHTVSHAGSSHGKLPVSVFSLWEEAETWTKKQHTAPWS